MIARPVSIVAMAGSVMLLGACEREAATASSTMPTATEIAGVDLSQSLSVSGNEPFWTLVLDGAKIAYSDPDSPKADIADLKAPDVMGNVAIYRSNTTDGQPLTITLSGTDCSDGMSDRVYPLAAKVEMGQRVLHGCAASTAAIARTGESGRVE